MVKVKNFFDTLLFWTILFFAGILLLLYLCWESVEYWVDNQLLKIKSKLKMKKESKKALVLRVATDMCTKRNKLSTKELKIELRNRYPDTTWNKYDNGKGVSDLFHELVREGKFVSVADNGTYQTYAAVGLPIKDRKGAPYIPDAEEVGMNIGGIMVNVSTVNTKRLSKGLVKASRKAAKPMILKKTTKSLVVKKKAPTKTIKVTAVPKIQKINKVKVVGAPKITKNTAKNLMQNSKGQFMTAVFVKKDGSTRKMNCQYLKDQSGSTGSYLKVRDAVKMKNDPGNSIRNVNLDTLMTLSVAGKQYNIK